MTDYIKTELAKYDLPTARITELKEKYSKLKVKSIEDIDNYLACKSAHQEVRDIRIAVEKKRKELKASSLSFGKAVDTEAKRLTASILEIEDHLARQRAVVEDEKKRRQDEVERKVKEEEDRLKKEEEDRLEAIRKEQEEKIKAEQDRLEKVRLEQEEKDKILKEQQDKIDADKKAIAEEKENNRLEKEKIKQAKIDDANAKKKAAQDEKDRIAREKKHAEDVEKAKKEAAAQAIRDKEEADRKAKEEKIEAQKKASDKDKLLELARVIIAIPLPDVKSKSSENIIVKVNGLLKQAYRLLKGKEQ